MPSRLRLHPLDLATLAVLGLALLWALLHLGGARWESGRVGAGFRRVRPVRVTVLIDHPGAASVAAALRPGPFSAQTVAGRVQVMLLRIERVEHAEHATGNDGAEHARGADGADGAEAGVRVSAVVPADIDRDGRAFFHGYRLRVGELFAMGSDSVAIHGRLVAVSTPEAARP